MDVLNCGFSAECYNSCKCKTIPHQDCYSCIIKCPGLTTHNINCAYTINNDDQVCVCGSGSFLTSCHLTSNSDLDVGGRCGIGKGGIGLIVAAVILMIAGMVSRVYYKMRKRKHLDETTHLIKSVKSTK